MPHICVKGGGHVSAKDATACAALPYAACDALYKDVPKPEPATEPEIDIEEVAGELDVPTPPKDDELTPQEQKLEQAVAEIAEAISAKASGASNSK